MDALALIWIVVSVAVAAFAQSLSGFGFALLSVPLMTLVVDPKDAVIISTFIGAFNSVYQAVTDRAHAEWSHVRRLTLASYVGMPFGFLAFIVVSDATLRAMVGVAVVAAAVLLLRGFALPTNTHRYDSLLGVISGVLSTSTSTNGPPLVFVLQARQLAPAVFRATINTVFSLVNIGAVSIFVVSGRVTVDGLLGVAVALPSTILFLFVGMAMRRHVEGDRFRYLVLGLLVLSGVSALLAAF